ncbi:universal stress protein [Pinisolibacter sp.]|uniref:universal stress protein n=1 Tax=Pinisolibacter sp. TaxID=2172024 RepID=UPI002FDE1580
MGLKRSSLEAGHRRKFLVVVDDTPECDRAVVFAARRAEHTGGGLVLLHIIEDTDFRAFVGVGEVMRQQAHAAAETVLASVAERVLALAGIEAERVIREGAPAVEVVRHIEADEDIAVLVLAAGTGSEGPGPLVTALAGRGAGAFPVPITIVPGHLSDADIAAIA